MNTLNNILVEYTIYTSTIYVIYTGSSPRRKDVKRVYPYWYVPDTGSYDDLNIFSVYERMPA